MKRLVDVVVSLSALALLSPGFVVLGLAVRIKLGSPVLFRQQRPGKNSQLFTLLKFRSMTDQKDAKGHWLPDRVRLTPWGQFMRSTSLDELPELWNVLKGEMSLVGPRPLLVEYLERYSPEQARRHDVRPGLTGWAQVNGRNTQSWEDRLRMDVWYVDNHSVLLDVKILIRTVGLVLRREGIEEQGQATRAEFQG